MSAQNSDTLISNALSRLGNPTLTTEAQSWLLNILDRFYQDFRWPFLEKVATGSITASQTAIALPTDFDELWDENSIVLIDPAANNARQYLVPISQFDYDLLAQPLTAANPPINVVIDANANTWTPFPTANKTYNYQIRYKLKPTRPSPYSNFTPTFPNDQLIEQAIFVTGLQREDDERYTAELTILKNMMGQYKAKFNKLPQKNIAVRLSPKFKGVTVLRS